jgi:flagellar basal-body rod protein FlgB
MENTLGGTTAAIVGYALDGLSLRQAAIASNIANANSPGYRPVQVDFESTLAALVGNGMAGESAVASLPKPTVAASASPVVGGQGLDAQVVMLNQNVLRHQALITGLNKYLSTVSTSINEGKR